MTGANDSDRDFSEVAAKLLEDDDSGEQRFWESPGVLESIRKGELPQIEILTEDERSEMDELISGVIGLLVQRHFGDKRAVQQLSIIHKLIFPKKYDVSRTVIERLSKKYESGHLTRGWELRRLMYRLSDLVAPIRPDTENVMTSPIRLLPQADPKHPLYESVVEQLKVAKRSTTLQMLAIRIYLKRVEGTQEVSRIDERTLKRDLQKLREWEESDVEHVRLKEEITAACAGVPWMARIPLRKYSESWIPIVPDDLRKSREVVSGKPGSDRKRKKSPAK
jgi:hypothetical protein